MGWHLTRGVAAFFNLVLSGLLLCFWFWFARDKQSNPDNLGLWLLVFSLAAVTMTATVAGVLLLMRRTASLGVKWNTATGGAWFAAAIAGMFCSLSDGSVSPGDAEAVAVLAGGGFVWFFMSWIVEQYRRLHRHDNVGIEHVLCPVAVATADAPTTLVQKRCAVVAPIPANAKEIVQLGKHS